MYFQIYELQFSMNADIHIGVFIGGVTLVPLKAVGRRFYIGRSWLYFMGSRSFAVPCERGASGRGLPLCFLWPCGRRCRWEGAVAGI